MEIIAIKVYTRGVVGKIFNWENDKRSWETKGIDPSNYIHR